jgi:16S rRNA processing protein RimM
VAEVSSPIDTPDDLVSIGKVGPAWGLQGSVFVQPLTDDVELRFPVGAKLRTDPVDRGPLTIAEAKWHGKRFVVHFDAVDDRTAAEQLRGTVLLMSAADRPALEDPDDFYDTDLVGLQARDGDGAALGDVTEIVHAPGGDYLVVRSDGRDRLIPFVRAIVPEVRLSEGFLVVDGPEGLLDL